MKNGKTAVIRLWDMILEGQITALVGVVGPYEINPSSKL
jgi:hypothetical protein